MKKIFGIVLTIFVLVALDTRAVADDGAASCSESKYGTGRRVPGNCIELDVETISKCKKTIKVYVNYSWEGTNGDEPCTGSKEKEYVMHVQPKQALTGHVTACRCEKVERAWIDAVIVKFF